MACMPLSGGVYLCHSHHGRQDSVIQDLKQVASHDQPVRRVWECRQASRALHARDDMEKMCVVGSPSLSPNVRRQARKRRTRRYGMWRKLRRRAPH